MRENAALISRAHRAGARIVLNAAPAGAVPEAALKQLDLLVVNEIEAETLCREAGPVLSDPEAAGRHLAESFGLNAVVTLGGDGARAFGPQGAWSVDALEITPVDTTGAGDAFVGVLAASLNRGDELRDALRRASVGAGLACLAEGAQTSLPDGGKIDRRLGDLAPARPL